MVALSPIGIILDAADSGLTAMSIDTLREWVVVTIDAWVSCISFDDDSIVSEVPPVIGLSCVVGVSSY